MLRAIEFGPKPAIASLKATTGEDTFNASFTREGVLSQYWLRAYKQETEPKEPKTTREKAEVSRYGQKGWSNFFSSIVRSFLPR